MLIKSLKYTNYKGLGTGEIKFDPRLTVVVGKNGSGKSSILQGVSLAASWVIARIKSEKGIGTYIDELSITNGRQNAQVTADFDEFGTITIPNRAISGISKKFSLNIDNLKEYANKVRAEMENTNFSNSIPIFAFYGVKRAVIDIPLRIRNKEENMLETYKECLNGAANFRNFFMWFRNQEDLENELRLDSDSRASNYSRELDTFRHAMSVFMDEYTNIKVKRRPLRMVVRKNNEELNVAQLSDGEKIYLALVGDLCRKLVLANPSLTDPLQGKGIVMIDEIDLHLHPKWQGEFASRLTEVFPNLQFIVTTHSPQVINRVPTESLRLLYNGEVYLTEYGYGMPTQVILKDIMGLDYEQPKEIEDTITGIYKSIAENDLDNARDLMLHLEEEVPNHPELTRIRKIVERVSRRN